MILALRECLQSLNTVSGGAPSGLTAWLDPHLSDASSKKSIALCRKHSRPTSQESSGNVSQENIERE